MLSDLLANDLAVSSKTHNKPKRLGGGNRAGEENKGGRGWKQASTVSRELSVQIPQRRKRSEDYEGECNNDDAAEVPLSKHWGSHIQIEGMANHRI